MAVTVKGFCKARADLSVNSRTRSPLLYEQLAGELSIQDRIVVVDLCHGRPGRARDHFADRQFSIH